MGISLMESDQHFMIGGTHDGLILSQEVISDGHFEGGMLPLVWVDGELYNYKRLNNTNMWFAEYMSISVKIDLIRNIHKHLM